MRVAAAILRTLYAICVAPATAVVLALLLVGLVISGEVTIIVSISVVAAWFVTVLSVAKWNWLSQRGVLGRLVIFLALASLLALAARQYVEWCLYHYSKTQPKPVQSSPGQSNGQLARQMKELFEQELRSLPTPKLVQDQARRPKGRTEVEPVVRITGLLLPPLEPGKPVRLNVHLINDHTELVSVYSRFCNKGVETVPNDFDNAANSKIEADLWACVEESMRTGPKIPIPVPPRVEVQVSDDDNALVVTDDIIHKLNEQSGIYVAGVVEDVLGKYKPTPYCVRIDKNRNGQNVSLCHSFSPPLRKSAR